MEIQSIIQEYIVREFLHERDRNVLDPDKPLIEDGVIDSMGLMKLVHFIEKKFSIEIVEEDLNIDNFRTVNALSNLVLNKTSSK